MRYWLTMSRKIGFVPCFSLVYRILFILRQQFLTDNMAFDILANPSTTDILMLTVLFLLFVMAIKKIMGIVTNMIMVSVAAILAPVLANRVLGLPIPTDTHSLITYIMVGIGAYFAYIGLKYVAGGLKTANKAVKKVIPKRKKAEKVRIIEKEHIHEHEAPERPRIVIQQRQSKPLEQSYKNYVVIEDNPSPKKAVQPAPSRKRSTIEPLPDVGKKKREED
jgi:hypothetical protein